MMHSASDQPSSEKRRFTLPRRTTSIIITVIVHLLLLLLLITLSPPRTFIPMGGSRLISIAVSSDQNEASKAKSQSKAKAATKPSKTTAAAAASKPVPPPPVPNPNAPEVQILKLTHDEMVGLDATLRSHSNNVGQQSADASSSGDSSGDSAKAGTGAHGEQLYAAEWYREPTHAELSTYMPVNRVGWGEVACRTVARYHVEDCYELDESPRGSQISRGVREAAWQFLVRPPRVGGRLMVGEWVRIRITLYDPKSERPTDR
jgi:protein TonB